MRQGRTPCRQGTWSSGKRLSKSRCKPGLIRSHRIASPATVHRNSARVVTTESRRSQSVRPMAISMVLDVVSTAWKAMAADNQRKGPAASVHCDPSTTMTKSSATPMITASNGKAMTAIPAQDWFHALCKRCGSSLRTDKRREQHSNDHRADLREHGTGDVRTPGRTRPPAQRRAGARALCPPCFAPPSPPRGCP